jgi:alpha-mannosidase
VAVEDGERGFAVFNRGLPEYEVTPDGTVYLTLLRCVGWLSRDDLATRRGHAGPPYETPEAQCLGVHRFEYAIYTYSGTWEEAGVLRVARDFTSPPLAQAIEGKISSSMTFFTLGPEGVVLSALKPPKEGDGVIVRVYNPLRRSVEAELRTSWSLSEVWELRLDETPIRKLDRASSHLLRFPLRPGEIKTFRVSVTRDDRG